MYVQALTESQKECERAQQATAELKQRNQRKELEAAREALVAEREFAHASQRDQLEADAADLRQQVATLQQVRGSGSNDYLALASHTLGMTPDML